MLKHTYLAATYLKTIANRKSCGAMGDNAEHDLMSTDNTEHDLMSTDNTEHDLMSTDNTEHDLMSTDNNSVRATTR